MLMRGADPVTTTCSEPGCSALAWCRGMCRRCYGRAYYRANADRLRQAARDRMPPAVVRPFTVTVGCVSCGYRFTVPAVGLLVCPECGRTLRPVLEISDRSCRVCRGPVPGGDQRAVYCSAVCREAAKQARRPPRDRRRAS